MDYFCNPATRPKAAKPHLCICCYAPIPKGETHMRQTGNYDGRWFDNRFHDECWSALVEEGDFEFTHGSGEPPERIQKAQEQPHD